MKKTIIYLTGLLVLAAGCKQDVVFDVDYNILLDGSNTYYAGEPVKFNIEGDVDNIIFYSGENGKEYVNKDRYSIPMEEVEDVKLNLSITSQYGNLNEGFSVYISKTFTGLDGTDGEADRTLIRNMVEGGMEGWKKIPYEDPKNGAEHTEEFSFSLNDYRELYSLAFHWNPQFSTSQAQRTYRVNGELVLTLKDGSTSSMALKAMDFTPVMMNEQIENPYQKNSGNGSIRFDTAFDISFQGVGANVLDYRLDGWCISTPAPANRLENDKGQVIKGIQNFMDSYEYTYSKPGTYKATFVGINSNYAAASKEIHEYTITIIEKPAGE